MSDKLYTQLKKHYDDVFAIEPTTFNNPLFTRLYKTVGQYVKHSPFRIVIPLSLLLTFSLFSIFGFFIIRVVSFFQHGF